MKIHISYETEEEVKPVVELLRPIIDRFKVKKSAGTPPYKHIYFMPKNGAKPRK